MGANALLAAQPDLRAGWEELYKQTDALTQGWLGAGIFAVTGRRDGLPAGAPPANDAAADADADADAAAGGGGAGAVQPDSEARARSGSSPGADGSPRPSDADGEAEALRRAPRASSPEVDHVLVTAGDSCAEGSLFSGIECTGPCASGVLPGRSAALHCLIPQRAVPHAFSAITTILSSIALVSSRVAGCLLPTLAKLILFKLDKIFPLTAGAEPDSQCHPCRLRSAGGETICSVAVQSPCSRMLPSARFHSRTRAGAEGPSFHLTLSFHLWSRAFRSLQCKEGRERILLQADTPAVRRTPSGGPPARRWRKLFARASTGSATGSV